MSLASSTNAEYLSTKSPEAVPFASGKGLGEFFNLSLIALPIFRIAVPALSSSLPFSNGSWNGPSTLSSFAVAVNAIPVYTPLSNYPVRL